MDYIDWCLQAYITTVTPVTYSPGFHDIIETILYTTLTFESFEALSAFVQNAVLYNGQKQLQTVYWWVCIAVLNNYLSQAYNILAAISYLAPVAVIIKQFWTTSFYLIRSTLAAYTKQNIDFYPDYSFPCECPNSNDCDTCKL